MIHNDIFSVSTPYQNILLDAYGVFWGGNQIGLLPGSEEAMEKLVSLGKTVGILSNTTQLQESEIAKLHKHGLIQGKHFHFLITSGEIAKQSFITNSLPFASKRRCFWVLGTPHPKYSSHEIVVRGSAFKEVKMLEEADFILVSIPHKNGEDQTDPSLFAGIIDEIKNSGLPMVCINPDHFAHEGNPPKAVVRQGVIASMYEKVGGKVHYFGKPSEIVFQVAHKQFEKHNKGLKNSILMVGDTPETDIKGAANFGIDSALVLTGIMGERIHQHGMQKAIEQLSPKPTHLIQRLGNV